MGLGWANTTLLHVWQVDRMINNVWSTEVLVGVPQRETELLLSLAIVRYLDDSEHISCRLEH